MQGWLDPAQGWLTEHTLKALKENVAHNRSGLPPFRLPHVAREIVAGLVAFVAGGGPEAAKKMGEGLGRKGLVLQAMMAIQRALLQESLLQLETQHITIVHDYASLVAEGVAAAAMNALTERAEMQILLEQAVQSRELELRKIIQELSTPIMPVHEHVLVLPLVGEIDEERAQRITERLLGAVSERRARIVIIDVTGVPEFDAAIADSLLRAARAVQLLGARAVLVGIRPEVAVALTRRDVDLQGLVVLADLQSGIAHALREQGLAVFQDSQRQPHPRRAGRGAGKGKKP
jgi:rsbT co-antagonist protein RsbR